MMRDHIVQFPGDASALRQGGSERGFRTPMPLSQSTTVQLSANHPQRRQQQSEDDVVQQGCR
ncbi:hypothetical protein [Microbacterium sp. AK031]|uniref:hypothetical protein n=1 Tax=Microbacterium sp. AK031 TaxID=2723076 RepID=UPI00216A60FA|nr:hypothetical protein [Microbacterium sp. AK031]MCS3842497.1 hypothetical protein [Microbacterium sp. AK031]